MLIDQENSNILPFCVILESRFNHIRLRLYTVTHQYPQALSYDVGHDILASTMRKFFFC